jgi:hypothetical protein
MSTVLFPIGPTPVWLVINPTRFPLMRCSESEIRTSIPVRTRPWAGRAATGTVLNARALSTSERRRVRKAVMGNGREREAG